MEKKGGENMTVQTVQNAGITGTGKDNRQSAAARDTFMEMLNTHLNQASDRKNANAGPGKAASQPGQKSGEPVKKEENTADILAYMESQRKVVCEIIGKGLAELNKPKKLALATPAQITTALGTLIDKWTAISGGAEDAAKEDDLSRSLREMARELDSDD